MSTENKCPLCGMLNPPTEWACESCGAQLPMHGKKGVEQQKTTFMAPPMHTQSVPSSAPAVPQRTITIGCVLLFAIALPLSCAVLNSGRKRNVDAPPAVRAPMPPVTVRAAPSAPQDVCSTGATAICADGTASYSTNRSGTCSRHGGVARWCR
jgi:hypothetical protein